MDPKSPSKSKIQIAGVIRILRSRKYVIVIILIVLILGLVLGYLIFREHFRIPKKINTYFTVVLDCGSTGSRVNIYEWSIGNVSNVDRDFGLPTLLRSYPENMNSSNGCQYHCMQTEPGLHNFVGNATGVRASLEPLISYAKRWVPLERHGETPIFVLATAGMRRLVNEDANRVLKDVKHVVEAHGFLYSENWVRALSGKEEAYYGWVALNYKMGVFGRSLRLSSTLGLLDLGGSSLQVVAEVDGSTKDGHVFPSKIGHMRHDIVAYSLPAFGLNEAFDRTVVMLSHTQAVRGVGGKFEVRHPCLSSGFIQNYTCHGCFGADSAVPKISENQVQEVFLVGELNWDRCKGIARAAAINSSGSDWLDRHHHSNCIGNTALNLTKTLHSVTHYHALSGFYAVYRALNLSQRVNLTMLWESGQKHCSGSRQVPKSFNGPDCFQVPYLASLIESTLCLNGMEIIFGPGDISWTLGASLIEGEFLWHHSETSQNSILVVKDRIAMPSPLLTFVLLLFLLLVVYFCQIKLPMAGRKPTSRASLPSTYKTAG